MANNNSGLNRRVYKEAICLFGRQTVNHCRNLSSEVLATEAEQVVETARQLRHVSGQPEKQRTIIQGMDELTVLALCRWLIDPYCMARYL